MCCIAGGLFNMDGTMSSSGNVVGRRYCIYAGGQIQSRSKGANAIPGTVEGYVEPNVGAAYY